MSLHLEFEPHSWYMGFAIKRECEDGQHKDEWRAYTDNGNKYRIDEVYSKSLTSLKSEIRAYHLDQHNGYGERIAKRRLEYLRGELRGGTMSYGEIVELQSLTSYIEDGDVELLEAAGVPGQQ